MRNLMERKARAAALQERAIMSCDRQEVGIP
jgi:hypothetical protein